VGGRGSRGDKVGVRLGRQGRGMTAKESDGSVRNGKEE